MEMNFAFCEWELYVVKTNSVFNKLRIYTNTSFVFPLSKKSYDFSEALIMPRAKGEKRQAPQELNVTAVLKYTLFRSGSSRTPTPTIIYLNSAWFSPLYQKSANKISRWAV